VHKLSSLQANIYRRTDRRAQNLPTVPSTLGEELSTNPFLRPDSLDIRNNLRMQNATDAQVFAEIRSRKDKF
ncbi:MAG: hydroxyacylglutathione hydrolase C-terminal domain-containing protein, partial [Paracoccaceae bacterium]